MKRMIRASIDDILLDSEMFKLVMKSGIGMQDTPWEGLEVITKKGTAADKHVIEIRLKTKNFPDFNGEPVHYTYSGCKVAHGTRSKADTLDDTAEYIVALQDALDFAYEVNDWLAANPEWS